tara:strand:- start:338 stop:580 length:243 start_codon:yes stop_codon:yes gene_type:complete
MTQLKHIKLYDTDFVLFKDGKPVESLYTIYGESSVKELFAEGFELEEGEQFIKMTELPAEWQQKYIDSIKESYKQLGIVK